MAVKVAINGFGRIGRLVLRASILNSEAWKELDFVAVNDITNADTMAHLLKYDTIHRTLASDVSVKNGNLVVNGKEIKVTMEKDPNNLPWKSMGVDIVVESTGKFTEKEKALAHINAGAKRVIQACGIVFSPPCWAVPVLQAITTWR